MTAETQKKVNLSVERVELEGGWFWPAEVHGPIQDALWRTRDMGYLHKAYAVLDALVEMSNDD